MVDATDYVTTTNNAITSYVDGGSITVCLGVSLDFENTDPSTSSWYIYFKTSDETLVLLSIKYTKSSTSGYNAALQPISATVKISQNVLNFNIASTSDQLVFPQFGAHSTTWKNYFVFGYLTSKNFEGSILSTGLDEVVMISSYFGLSSATDLFGSALDVKPAVSGA